MNPDKQKTLDIPSTDIICEYKTISDPVGDTRAPLSFHNHDGYELLLMLEGDLDFYTEASGKKLERGDLVCMQPYDFHRAVLITPSVYERIVINLRETALKELSSEQSDLSACFYTLPSKKLNIIHLDETETKQLIEKSKMLQKSLSSINFGSDLLAKACLIEIMVLINRHISSNQRPEYHVILPDLVAKTFAYIDKHLTEIVSLQDIADEIHHNQTYLCRCFKKVTGLSMQQYIIIKKIALAQKYLSEGHSPCDVCYMVGFNNYSNFSRTFSKQVGSSPKKYQLNHH